MAQRIAFHLTDRCQLDCAHCLRDPTQVPHDLEFVTIESVLGTAEQYGIERISLTGGEPTLHPRFLDILASIARRGLVWDVVTNGQRFARIAEWIDSSPETRRSCAQVVFSLDGASDRVHDAIRGEGQRRQVLSSIAVAAAFDIPFAVSATLHRGNESELERIGLEAAQLGARQVTFAMMQPTGTHFDAELGMSADAWREVYARIVSLANALKIPVIAAEGWPDRQRLRACDALRGDTLHVDHRGMLTLCCAQSDVPGDPSGRTIAGPAAQFVASHRVLLGIHRDALAARLDELENDSAWSDFSCNNCLRNFDRVHWNDRGTAGNQAARARWRGAWSKPGVRKTFLPILR